MSPLLAPLLAQLVSLQVADRTEARYIKSDTGRYEGSTTPSVVLSVGASRTNLRLSYNPVLSLVPLEKEPRELYVFQVMSASLGYRLTRSTSLALSSSLGIGSLNFRLLGLQGPLAPNAGMGGVTPVPSEAPPTGTPNPGTPTGSPNPATPNATITRAEDRKVRYYTLINTLGLAHQINKRVTLSATGGSTIASGRDEESRRIYAPLRGWFVSGATSYVYRVSAKDALTSSISLMKSWSSNNNEVATLNATETWGHRFAKRTSGSLGAGLSATRFSQADGLRGVSVFPAFYLSIAHQTRLGRGMLSVGASAFCSPALDPLRALVDPRVGMGASIGYGRKKFALLANGSTAFSVAPADNNAGAVNSLGGDARVIYELATLTQVDAGARVARQTYQGASVIPITWAAFVGVNFGYSLTLSGKRTTPTGQRGQK